MQSKKNFKSNSDANFTFNYTSCIDTKHKFSREQFSPDNSKNSSLKNKIPHGLNCDGMKTTKHRKTPERLSSHAVSCEFVSNPHAGTQGKI